jgi:hypothetical protein
MGMREHIREAPANKSPGYILGIVNKTHRSVAIIQGINHSSSQSNWAEELERDHIVLAIRKTSSNS